MASVLAWFGRSKQELSVIEMINFAVTADEDIE